MRILEPPDSHYISAAQGWLGLGNLAEARLELERVNLRFHEHPEFLAAQWLILAEEQNWPEALATATHLKTSAPEDCAGWLHAAYALRRVEGGGVDKARDALLPALNKFPLEPIVPYNLSCYACLLGDHDNARRWLKRAIGLGGKGAIKPLALADEDLRTLWPEIQNM